MMKVKTLFRAPRLDLLPYLFVFPLVFLIAVIFLYPLCNGILLSFYEDETFVGLANYFTLSQDPQFWHSLRLTLIYVGLYIGGVFFVGLFTALVINHAEQIHAKGDTVAGTIIMLPYAIPDAVASLVWYIMFDLKFGVVNYFLSLFGISPVKWLLNPDVALYSVLITTIWRLFPLHCMIILAAFRAVPRELYEAAEIDGATAVRKFISITLPSIQGIMGLLVLITIVWSFKRFTILWLMTGGGPGRATETLVIQIYRNAFKFFRENYASALSMIGMLIVIFITVIYFAITGRKEEEEAKIL